MNWLEEFSPKEQKLWQEIMLSHSFDTEEWGAAREMLKLILENDFTLQRIPFVHTFHVVLIPSAVLIPCPI